MRDPSADVSSSIARLTRESRRINRSMMDGYVALMQEGLDSRIRRWILELECRGLEEYSSDLVGMDQVALVS
jgi:hypothetical protein